MAKRRTRSLSLQIGLLYMFLAIINILFFSAMIFENQSDLLLKNFKFQSDQVVNTVINELEGIQVSRESDENITALAGALKAKGMDSFVIFGSDGQVWHRFPADPNGEKTVSAALKRQSLEISGETADFRSRYTKELNQDDFSVQFLLPLRTREGGTKAKDNADKGPPGEAAAKEPGLKDAGAKAPTKISTAFLSTRVSIKEIQNRLRELYFQMGLAVAWGVVFHVVFGIFVYRVIFRRLGVLKETSEKMGQGELSARATWKKKRGDELDELGEAFNIMASTIEEKVDTISKLNTQIQQELEIGKEVQELFLPSKLLLKKHNTATYFKPLREVSGDVYSVFDVSEKYRGLFFADASGHGVSAALVTTITLMNLENVLKGTIKPQEVVGRLNQIMSDKFQSSFYATAVFCLIGDGVVVYCNAGHPPPLFFRPSTGQLLLLEKGGPPVGMIEEAEYEARMIKTKPGDRLILYSDGLTETFNAAGEQFGTERVEKIVTDNGTKSGAEIAELLGIALAGHAAEYTDDVSVVAVELP